MDRYGTDLFLNANGDLVLDNTGDLAAVSGPRNVAQAMRLRLICVPGELVLHPEYGSDLDRRSIGAKAPDIDLVTTQARIVCSRLVREDPRMLAVRDVTATAMTADGTQVAVSATIQLAGGESITTTDLIAVRADELTVQGVPLNSVLAAADLVLDPTDELPELDDALILEAPITQPEDLA